MQTTKSKLATLPMQSERVVHRVWIASLAVALSLAFVLETWGFQIYWSKERRLIFAADEIVTALKTYRDSSPGTAKEFPLELANLMRDPRMLADKGYIATLPVDPSTLKQEWDVVRNKNNQMIGVHSLSNDTPTPFSRLLSFRGGDRYSNLQFIAQ